MLLISTFLVARKTYNLQFSYFPTNGKNFGIQYLFRHFIFQFSIAMYINSLGNTSRQLPYLKLIHVLIGLGYLACNVN